MVLAWRDGSCGSSGSDCWTWYAAVQCCDQELDCWIVNQHIQLPDGKVRPAGLSWFKAKVAEAIRLGLMTEAPCT